MNLTEQQITDALRGTDYENSHYDSSAINYCRQNAAKVILLEGVVRELVGALKVLTKECDELNRNIILLNAHGFDDAIAKGDAALHQAKQIMGEE